MGFGVWGFGLGLGLSLGLGLFGVGVGVGVGVGLGLGLGLGFGFGFGFGLGWLGLESVGTGWVIVCHGSCHTEGRRASPSLGSMIAIGLQSSGCRVIGFLFGL